MEFYVQKSTLEEHLSRLMGVIEKRSAIPILENVLVKSHEGMGIKLSATNLELGIYSTCLIEQMTGEGALCIPSHKLFDIIRLMPDGLIKVSGNANLWTTITAKGSNFKIPCSNPDSFPALGKLPGNDDWLTVPAKTFRSILRGVEFAISTEENARYSIAGIKVEINDSGIRMVATDGHRLSLAAAPLDVLLLNDLDILLPKKAVNELSKFILDSDTEISIAVIGNEMFFKIGTRVLYSRILAGQFPSYKSMFDTVHPYFTTFQADVFGQSIKRAMIVADAKQLSCVLIHFKEGKVHLSASTADGGECDEVMDSDFNGPETKVACSGKFVMDFLEQIGTDKVRFELKDGAMPLFFKSVRGDVAHHYTVIPMRTENSNA